MTYENERPVVPEGYPALAAYVDQLEDRLARMERERDMWRAHYIEQHEEAHRGRH